MNRVYLCDVALRRSHKGSSCDVLGFFVMFEILAAIPSIVEYRKIILLGHTRSHDFVQRHLTIQIKDIARRSKRLCDDRATSCNGRAMVVR